MNQTISVEELATDRMSIAVILAVAEVENVDPIDLPPLGNSIDPRAIDLFFDAPGRTNTLTFEYHTYEIHIEKGERIILSEVELENP